MYFIYLFKKYFSWRENNWRKEFVYIVLRCNVFQELFISHQNVY